MIDRHQRRHAAAAHVFRPNRVARAFRRDHDDVEVGTRLDQIEMNVEAVREGTSPRLLSYCRAGHRLIDIALQFIRRQHHDDIGPGRGFRRRHAGEAGFG